MAETTQDTGATQDKGARPAPQTKTAVESSSFNNVLGKLAGKVVTVVNPESYEHAPVGYQLKAGFYRGKVTGVGQDYLILATEFVRTGKNAGKEPVRQYIPVGRIKRLSILEKERILHL